jgi:hypothetical protein
MGVTYPFYDTTSARGITNLLVLNSDFVGARDLHWVDDPHAKKGYNIYRSFDFPTNWVKLNLHPLTVHFFRDETTLLRTTHTIQPTDFVEKGEEGHWVLRIPDIPYSNVVKGRAQVCNNCDEVTILMDGVPFRPIQVQGLDQQVFIQQDRTLPGTSTPPGDGVGEAPGAVSTFPAMPNLNEVKVFQVVYNKLINFVDIYTTLVRTFYTVVGVGADGRELHKPGDPHTEIVDTQQVDRMDYMQREMVRRNDWIFEQVGEPAFLMFRRTRGDVCGCTQGDLNQPKHGCPSCFEVGIVGGYFGPYDFLFIDPDSQVKRTLQEGGIEVERESTSYIGPTPIVQDGDLIIRRNGERLIINNVRYKNPRGVLLMQDYQTKLLVKGDTRYLIPVVYPMIPPSIYNPVTDTPVEPNKGGEPISQRINDPDKGVFWENPDKQDSRTIAFNRIKGSPKKINPPDEPIS